MAKTDPGKFTRVADALRAQITGGTLQAGDWLPSEAQLVDQYQVSRYSAREGIKQLAAEGLIVVVDGKGSHVRARRDRAAHADPRVLRHDTGPDGRERFRDAETDAATGRWSPVEEPVRYRSTAGVDVALSLGVPEHTPLFIYDRLFAPRDSAPGEHGGGDRRGAARDAVGQRRMSHRFYLPVSTCAGVAALAEDPFRDPGEVYTLLAEAGHELRWVEHVRATRPAPDDTTSLHIPTGAPVLITRRVTTNTTGRPLAMEETRRNAEDTQLTYPVIPTASDG